MEVLSCEENQDGFAMNCCKFSLSLFDKVSFRLSVVFTNCLFDQVSFDQLSFDQGSFVQLSGHGISTVDCIKNFNQI